jgi:hypothetical protein
MQASWGQRSAPLAASRWRSEVLIDSGGLAMRPSCPARLAAPWSACLPVPMSYALAPLTAPGCEQHYNATARPFDWKFTRTDLNQLQARVKQHDRHAPTHWPHEPRQINRRDH